MFATFGAFQAQKPSLKNSGLAETDSSRNGSNFVVPGPKMQENSNIHDLTTYMKTGEYTN